MKNKILIVDDENGARESLKNILSKYFSEEVEVVGTANNIADAEEMINTLKPALVSESAEQAPTIPAPITIASGLFIFLSHDFFMHSCQFAICCSRDIPWLM